MCFPSGSTNGCSLPGSAPLQGLGKTIQTIAMLAYMACEKGIWGPHLIVVPTSVMLNWEMEFKKWCPAFKIMTYYGTPKQRAQKRQVRKPDSPPWGLAGSRLHRHVARALEPSLDPCPMWNSPCPCDPEPIRLCPWVWTKQLLAKPLCPLGPPAAPAGLEQAKRIPRMHHQLHPGAPGRKDVQAEKVEGALCYFFIFFL